MAQLAEQLICNQQVIGSSPIIGLVLTGLKDFGPLAQLVRAPPCHGGGREFESLLGRSRCESILRNAAVAELADARDLKSRG